MKKFAVFDIDGTLIRWQLYHVITDRLAKSGALGEKAPRDIRDARMRWKRRESKEGFHEYEKVLIQKYEAALTKIKPEEFDELVLSVIEEYKDQVYTYTRNLIETLRKKGYFLLAISGSHQELVGHMAQYYKFDDFIGSQYERTSEGFSGKSYIPSFDKASALRKLVETHNLDYKQSYAVGDTSSDAPMLEMVENPIAFNPDTKLFEAAQKNGWKVVVERKNMIYQLEQQNGIYLLASTDTDSEGEQ